MKFWDSHLDDLSQMLNVNCLGVDNLEQHSVHRAEIAIAVTRHATFDSAVSQLIIIAVRYSAACLGYCHDSAVSRACDKWAEIESVFYFTSLL